MSYKMFFAVVMFSSLTLWAADSVTPLNVKEGLWEVTTTHSMSGMPPIPPEVMAKMPPEQQARMAAAMAQRGVGTPKTDVRKSCVTKEKLEKHMAFDEDRKECTRTVVSSSSNHLEMKIHCEYKEHGMTTDGNLVMDVLGAESTKGTMHAVSTGSGNKMNIDVTFSSRYLGPSCGDVK